MSRAERAHVYGRVSGDEAFDSRAGINAQVDGCVAFAAANGWQVVGPYLEDEAITGAAPIEKRPKLMELLGELKRGDIVLVLKRDRIARDKYVMVMIEQLLKTRGCRLVSASGEGSETADPNDPFAFLHRGIADLFSQYERLQAIWRTKGAMAAKRKRGERTGRVPYGMTLVDDGRRSKSKTRKDGTTTGAMPIALIPNSDELAVLSWMWKLRAEGWTVDRVTWALNARGTLTKAGKPWQKSSVGYVLKRIESDPCHPARTPAGQAVDNPLATASAS